MTLEDRYVIKTGKFGQYFYDAKEETDMPLVEVLRLLNKTCELERLRGMTTDSILDDKLVDFIDDCQKQQFMNALVHLNKLQQRVLELFNSVMKDRA
jgi:hypothetical protein